MLNETQKEKIIYQLKSYGFISRNWCLQRFISRLGAIINILKKNGWEFRGEYKTDKYFIKKNDKIGQIILCKLGSREIIEIEKLSDSERGNNAHYSSGK